MTVPAFRRRQRPMTSVHAYRMFRLKWYDSPLR